MAPITPEFISKVKIFQTNHGLDVDGIIGPDTLAAIELDYKQTISEWQLKNATLKSTNARLEEQLHIYKEKARGTKPFSIGVVIGALGGFLGALGVR